MQRRKGDNILIGGLAAAAAVGCLPPAGSTVLPQPPATPRNLSLAANEPRESGLLHQQHSGRAGAAMPAFPVIAGAVLGAGVQVGRPPAVACQGNVAILQL